MTEKKPLILELNIPYCIRPEKYSRRMQLMGSSAEKNAYLEAMMREILAWEGELEGCEIVAVKLGGGAATVMKPDLLGALLKLVREKLPVAPLAEMSFDALPSTIGTPSLSGISAGKPNRAELTVYSDNEAELRAIDASFATQDTKNAVLYFNRFRVNNLGAAVYLSLPGQTMSSWKKTLNFCAGTRFKHISINTPDEISENMPESSAVEEMYSYAVSFLAEEGYINYGAGLFCLPGFENRFESYLRNGCDVIGIGAGAVTVTDGFMTRNTNNTAIYIRNAGDFEKTVAAAAELNADAVLRRYISGRMGMSAGFDLAETEKLYGPVPESIINTLNTAVNDGLAEKTAGGYAPTVKGAVNYRALKAMLLAAE